MKLKNYWIKKIKYFFFYNSCVLKENCDSQLDVRGADDDYGDYYGDSAPTCNDDSQTCCHKDKIIESDEPNLCAKHSNIGFR